MRRNQTKNKTLFVFVEGPDDEKFINIFIRDKKCFKKKYNKIKCVKYGEGLTASKINKYIDKVIVKLEHDYIFLGDADFDGKNNSFTQRKKKLKEIYKLSNENKIWIVIEEIESWFLAGFSKEFCQKEKLNFKQNTEKVTKEIFDKIDKNKKKKTHNQLIDFLIRKKTDFSFEDVNNRNSSLSKFYEHFELDC